MNQVRVNSPFRNHESFTGSCFASEVERTAAFSLKNLFKKKDKTANTSTEKVKKTGSGTGAAIATSIAGLFSVAGGLAPILPSLGIGSKSRIAETNATAAANVQVLNAQMQLAQIQEDAEQKKQNILIIAGVGVVVLIIAVIVLTRK